MAHTPTTPTTAPSGLSGFLASRAGQVVTAVIIAVAIVTAFLGSGAIGGTPVDETAGGWLSEDGTWIAPASAAFRIWSVIYLGLVAYGIWQFLAAAQTLRHQALRPWILAGVLLNSVWIWVVQLDWLGGSVLVIFALLACLARTLVLLERDRPENWAEVIVLDGVQGLYLGWVSIASITNVAAWLAALGWSGEPLGPEAWTVIMIVAAVVVSGGVSVYTGGRITPALAVAWGLSWVAVGRTDGTGPQSLVVAGAAAVAAVVIIVIALVCRWAAGHRHGQRAGAGSRPAQAGRTGDH